MSTNTIKPIKHEQPLVVPFNFGNEELLAVRRSFWQLPISTTAKSFYLIMLSQEDDKSFTVEEFCRLYDFTPQEVHACMSELSCYNLAPRNVRGWEHA